MAMNQNYKFHAVAIVIICVVITLIYTVIGQKKPAAPASAQTDHVITIYNATWGENCNPGIRQAIIDYQNTPREKDKDGVLIESKAPALVEHNNVLDTVSTMCNGKVTCDILVTSGNLKVEPLSSCSKTLELGYRCYNFDRLTNSTISQGQTTTIDCNANSKPAAK